LTGISASIKVEYHRPNTVDSRFVRRTYPMQSSSPSLCPAWQKLIDHARTINQPENHLGKLIQDPRRISDFSLKTEHFFFDFSRQRVTPQTLSFLMELAKERNLQDQFAQMCSGAMVNVTEKRAALHTASRSFSDQPVFSDGTDIMPEIRKIRSDIQAFSDAVRNGKIVGSTGKAFRHIVVIGIGGSYLGTEFVSEALTAFSDGKIAIHYLANVDIHNFGQLVREIDPETTLWIIISKSYTTAETAANEAQARAFMAERDLSADRHFVTVTAKGSPGDRPGSSDMLASFHMFDFIGGRYSVTSAVGGVPLSLFLGYECFEKFLKGAEAMDRHAAEAPIHENIPLMAALLSVWNNNFLGYPAQAIIPYAQPLSKLAPHVQQLNMESNGKSVSTTGEPLSFDTGGIIFGEPGTNAQHSFFQLAHQGRPFPIEFIGVIRPQFPEYALTSKGVTNHQELWANLISQPQALAIGFTDKDPARSFSGNRPSSTILLDDLSPESVGRLLSFYEARTVFEAFIWGINPFDQFGVELGKKLATAIRSEMARENEESTHEFKNTDPISKFYLEALFREKG
jgi:glucose-6-phosphate isomerase